MQDTGRFLCVSGLGEGIVIKNYDYVNKFGRRTWAKMLTEDFLSTKKDNRQRNKQIKQGECEHPAEEKIVFKYLTEEHISKEYHKLCEKYNEAVLGPSHIFELLMLYSMSLFLIIGKLFSNSCICPSLTSEY